jgi:hypothetical protein
MRDVGIVVVEGSRHNVLRVYALNGTAAFAVPSTYHIPRFPDHLREGHRPRLTKNLISSGDDAAQPIANWKTNID